MAAGLVSCRIRPGDRLMVTNADDMENVVETVFPDFTYVTLKAVLHLATARIGAIMASVEFGAQKESIE